MAFRLFSQFANDAPLGAIDRALASKFLSAIATLDPNWGKLRRSEGLMIRELLETFGNHPQGLSNKTLNRYASSLSGLFKWARRRSHFERENPFAEQSRPKARKTGWRPFTIEELNKLFASLPDDAPMRWLPRIALFSGLRVGEISQLRVEDVKRKGKVWFFNVEEPEGGRLKTEAATRRVPVHSQLIKAGLLDYVKALRPGLLFPTLTPGGPDGKLSWNFVKRFTRYRRRRAELR